MVPDNSIRCAAVPVHRCQCDRRIQSISQGNRHGIKSITIQIYSTSRIIDGFNLEDFCAVCIIMDSCNATVVIDSAIAALRTVSYGDTAPNNKLICLCLRNREVCKFLASLYSCRILQIIASATCVLFLAGFHHALDRVEQNLPRDFFAACALVTGALLGVVRDQTVMRLVACRNEVIYASQQTILTNTTEEL